MAKLKAFGKSFLSTIGLRTAPPDMDALRELCITLLADVPAFDRNTMLERLGKMRRADDLWHLRGALFDTISRVHGETVARARIEQLDAQLV